MEEFESRYVEVTVQSRAASPPPVRSGRSTSARCSDAASCCSISADRQQLAAFGEVRTPSIADLFVAVMGNQAGDQLKEWPYEYAIECRTRVLRLAENRRPPPCRQPGPFTGRCDANCGRTVRSTSRRWLSPALALFGFLISHDWSREYATPRPGSQGGSPGSSPTPSPQLLVMATAFIVGVFYSSRRAARRAPRPQHPLLEVAAGLRSHDRALEGRAFRSSFCRCSPSRSPLSLQWIMLLLSSVVLLA